MLAESALRSALDKVTPIELAGKFWRVVTTSSLLGLVRGENGRPEVTRIHPHLLFAGGPRRVGGRMSKLYDRRGQKVLLEDMERIRY